jgi:hypothetical protein
MFIIIIIIIIIVVNIIIIAIEVRCLKQYVIYTKIL